MKFGWIVIDSTYQIIDDYSIAGPRDADDGTCPSVYNLVAFCRPDFCKRLHFCNGRKRSKSGYLTRSDDFKAGIASVYYEVTAVVIEPALAKQIAIEIVGNLENERSIIISHYLVLLELNITLLKYVSESPIFGIDPITMSLMREIGRFRPDLSSNDQREIRLAIDRYLIDNDWADRFFEREATFHKLG